MNLEDLKAMARTVSGPDAEDPVYEDQCVILGFEELERFAALIAAKERERVAAWIEPQRNDIPAMGEEFASAIRKMMPKP